MSVLKTLAWYAVPRPITEVVMNGVKVYQCFRSNRQQARNHAKEMFTVIFRVIAAVPFVVLSKLAADYHFQNSFGMAIKIDVLSAALGVMMWPSFMIGWFSGFTYYSLNKCYFSRDSRLKGIYGLAGLTAYYFLQRYNKTHSEC